MGEGEAGRTASATEKKRERDGKKNQPQSEYTKENENMRQISVLGKKTKGKYLAIENIIRVNIT